MASTVSNGHISGNGPWAKKCQAWFKDRLAVPSALLTTSCTDALEMAAILTNIGPGDEVILPSYTFVSTANAFALRGATLVFADSRPDHPGIDESTLEELITPRTRVIVPVHYAGVACNMELILTLDHSNSIWVVEDAAQAVDAFFTNSTGEQSALGAMGHLGAFSFHETKNIMCGEGGLLSVRDPFFMERAEIIWEKGTNRSSFFRGEVDKYGWVDMGSSFLPSEIIAAFLWAQLENLQMIQERRLRLWNIYLTELDDWAKENSVSLPVIPSFASNNAHMFYLVFKDITSRDKIIAQLKSKNILSVFHYLSLHSSKFYANKHDGRNLPETDRYSECLLRLPMFYELDIDKVIDAIKS